MTDLDRVRAVLAEHRIPYRAHIDPAGHVRCIVIDEHSEVVWAGPTSVQVTVRLASRPAFTSAVDDPIRRRTRLEREKVGLYERNSERERQLERD